MYLQTRESVISGVRIASLLRGLKLKGENTKCCEVHRARQLALHNHFENPWLLCEH